MTTTLPARGLSARAVATAALERAGVYSRRLSTLDGVRAAEALFAQVWRGGDHPLPAEVMRAVDHAGGYVTGVYDGATLVGASAGFLGVGPDGDRCRLHSHITGVLPQAQGRSIGRALKLHQRAWALDRGVETITWTFDPLVRRNAWFNLAKLAAHGVEYLVDFYGPMLDEINAGEPTDRLYVEWDLLSPAVSAAAAGERRTEVGPVDAATLVSVALAERDGRPRVPEGVAPARFASITLPADIERLRYEDPEAAHEWRLAVRAALAPLLDAGRRVVGMSPDGSGLLVGT